MSVGVLGQRLAAAISSPGQTITAIASDTELVFDTVMYDPSSMVDLVANRVQIFRSGAYRCSLEIEFDPQADSDAEIEMYGVILGDLFGRIAIELVPLPERLFAQAGQGYIVYSMTGTAMLDAGEQISAAVNLFTLGTGSTVARILSARLAVEQIRAIASTTGGGSVPGPASLGIPSPAVTVADSIVFGQAPDVGSGTRYARNDHVHGTPPAPAAGGALNVATTWINRADATTSDGTAFTNAGRQTASPPTPGEAYIEATTGAGRAAILTLPGFDPGSLVTVSLLCQTGSGGGTFLYVGSGTVFYSCWPLNSTGVTPTYNGELPAGWSASSVTLTVGPTGEIVFSAVFAARLADLIVSVLAPTP